MHEQHAGPQLDREPRCHGGGRRLRGHVGFRARRRAGGGGAAILPRLLLVARRQVVACEPGPAAPGARRVDGSRVDADRSDRGERRHPHGVLRRQRHPRDQSAVHHLRRTAKGLGRRRSRTLRQHRRATTAAAWLGRRLLLGYRQAEHQDRPPEAQERRFCRRGLPDRARLRPRRHLLEWRLRLRRLGDGLQLHGAARAPGAELESVLPSHKLVVGGVARAVCRWSLSHVRIEFHQQLRLRRVGGKLRSFARQRRRPRRTIHRGRRGVSSVDPQATTRW
jgi:hypothetical protein